MFFEKYLASAKFAPYQLCNLIPNQIKQILKPSHLKHLPNAFRLANSLGQIKEFMDLLFTVMKHIEKTQSFEILSLLAKSISTCVQRLLKFDDKTLDCTTVFGIKEETLQLLVEFHDILLKQFYARINSNQLHPQDIDMMLDVTLNLLLFIPKQVTSYNIFIMNTITVCQRK